MEGLYAFYRRIGIKRRIRVYSMGVFVVVTTTALRRALHDPRLSAVDHRRIYGLLHTRRR